jgi:hypothetical protein
LRSSSIIENKKSRILNSKKTIKNITTMKKTIKNNSTIANRSGTVFKMLTLSALAAGIFILHSCEKEVSQGRINEDVISLIHSVEVFQEAEEFAERVEVLQENTWIQQTNTDPRLRSLVPAGDEEPDTRNALDCFAFSVEWKCTTKRISASRNPDDFVMFNPLASVLWPGNLVQGKSLESGIPTAIPVAKRQPGNISLAIVTGGAQGAAMYRTVDRMSFSGVNQAMNNILSEFPGQGYAQYNFEMDVVESSEHLEFLLNASFSGWGATAKAGFSTGSSHDMSRILVRLHQAYFTMVYDDPHGLDGVFTPDITVNDLRNYTDNGNPICYISSVTYGRIFYLLYESDATVDSLRIALNASFKGLGVNAGADFKRQIQNTLDKTTARVFQLGGDGAGGITAGIAVELDGIQAFMERGINFNAQNVGAPISYTVKYLKNAQLVRMNSMMQFDVEECVPTVTENDCFGQVKVIDLATVSESGDGYTWRNNVLTVNNGADIIITTNSVTTARRIAVNGSANITLRNVSITSDGASPITLNRDANLTLTIEGTNRLTASRTYAGIQTSDAILTIRGTGTLIATGGRAENSGDNIFGMGLYRSYMGAGAGIGGSYSGNGGTITINSGTVIAQGGRAGNGELVSTSFMGTENWAGIGGGGAGAGIGGGGGYMTSDFHPSNGGTITNYVGNGATVIINGGTITATGGAHGSGSNGNGSSGLARGGGGGGGAGANIGGGGGAGGAGGIGGTSSSRGGSGANGTISDVFSRVGGNGGNGGSNTNTSASFAIGDRGGTGGAAGVLINNR